MKLIYLFAILQFISFSVINISSRKKSSLKKKDQDDTTPAALLVIDMQRFYLEKKYPGYVPNTENLIDTIAEIRKKLKSMYTNLIEIYSVDCLMDDNLCALNESKVQIPDELFTNKNDPTSIPKKSERGKIHPLIGKGQKYIEEVLLQRFPDFKTQTRFILEKANEKAEYSLFGETWEGRNEYGNNKDRSVANSILLAKKVKKVYVVGLAYQQCVLFTAADAAYLKYDTYIVENGSKPSIVITGVDGKSIPDINLVNEQKVEAEKVKKLVINKKNGLPGWNGEKLTIVTFIDNAFIEK